MTPLFLPAPLIEMLASGMDVAISISGGKDSQAMLIAFVAWFRSQRFPGRLSALHTTLGRAERTETPGFLEALCTLIAIPLIVVQPVIGGMVGDLLDSLEHRMHQMEGTNKPFWPTMGYRYCTALKVGACDKDLRRSLLIVSLEGIRAAESESRAEKQPFSIRSTITGERYKHLALEAAWTLYQEDRAQGQHQVQFTFFEVPEQVRPLPRLAVTLYPLFYWNEEEVWRACGTSMQELARRRALYQQGIEQEDPALRALALHGWVAHPAYVKGARRLSCSLCILADKETLRSGAYDSPAYYRQLVWMEIESGFSFQQGRWLADVAPALLTDEQHQALAALPQRQLWLQKKRRRSLQVLPGVRSLPSEVPEQEADFPKSKRKKTGTSLLKATREET